MLTKGKIKGIIPHKVTDVIFAIAFFLFLGSCDNGLRYEKFQKVDAEAWNFKDELNFKVPIAQETTKQLEIAVRNTADYQKANLWLFLTVTSPLGKVVKDTIDCPLADDYGYWLGDGFSGLYLTTHTVNKSIPFNEKGDWEVKITHGMREDAVKGVREVGVLIKESKN